MHLLFWALSFAFWILGAIGITNERFFPNQRKWLVAVYLIMTIGWVVVFLLSFSSR